MRPDGAATAPRDASGLLALPIAALAGLVELTNGRAPICRCGIVRLWAGRVDGPENSQQIADWYSPSHFIHGLLFYAVSHALLPRCRLGLRLAAAVAIEAAWEIVENSPWIIDRYRAATIAQGYAGDSILNSMSDIGFMALGFACAARWRVRTSILAGVLLELVALVAVRDNLTLNVLMLLHPIAGVRAWQAG